MRRRSGARAWLAPGIVIAVIAIIAGLFQTEIRHALGLDRHPTMVQQPPATPKSRESTTTVTGDKDVTGNNIRGNQNVTGNGNNHLGPPAAPAPQNSPKGKPKPDKSLQKSQNNVNGTSNVVGNSVSGQKNVTGNGNVVNESSTKIANAPGGIAITGGTVTNPTVNNYAAPPYRTVPNLTFAISPAFTPQRKQRIGKEIGGFQVYLQKIGFDIAQDIPPIATRPGKGLGMSAISPGTSYNRKILIGEQGIDDPRLVIRAYAQYYFESVIGTFGTAQPPDAAREQLASIYEGYFVDSYSGRHVLAMAPPSKTTQWVDALWNVRALLGAEVTDKALFIGNQRRSQIPMTDSQDIYILTVVRMGFDPLLNLPSDFAAIDQILRADGLTQ